VDEGPFEELKVLQIGAEAVVRLVRWGGFLLVAKTRVPKPYRRPEVDLQVRTERTEKEARVMHRAKRSGVPCPAVVHLELSTSTIYMQYVVGEDLRSLLRRADEGVRAVARALGNCVARLHSADLYHGDLVPSNVIVQSGRPYLIDFGLSGHSQDIEEHATDYHLLDRSLRSGFPDLADAFMEDFRSGYEEVAGSVRTREVLERVEEIRARGRYVERVED
jgi:TP53 regulating kinase-like protein